MPKFWKVPGFKEQQKLWYQRLTQEGFQDMEDLKGNLKNKNRRTIAFENRQRIRDFFFRLRSFLANNRGSICFRDLRILALYSQGIKIKGPNGIVARTGWSDKTIRNLIKKYKKCI